MFGAAPPSNQVLQCTIAARLMMSHVCALEHADATVVAAAANEIDLIGMCITGDCCPERYGMRKLTLITISARALDSKLLTRVFGLRST